MAEAAVYGFNCKLYFDDGGTALTTPSAAGWEELTVVKDATLDLGFTESDASIRGAGGFELTEPVLQQVSINATFEWINGNAQCEALWDAFFARTALNIMALTGAKTNPDAVGVLGDFKIVKFPRKEELKESVKFEMTLKPCRSLRSNFVQKTAGIAP